MIYIILGRFTKDAADDLALPPEDSPEKRSASARRQEIQDVIEHVSIGGALRDVYWTLGEFDAVITFQVATLKRAAAAALAIATRLGLGTTTLTGFGTDELQQVMDDSGHAGYG